MKFCWKLTVVAKAIFLRICVILHHQMEKIFLIFDVLEVYIANDSAVFRINSEKKLIVLNQNNKQQSWCYWP